MLIDGLFNFLNFIVSPSDQPQKFIAVVGIVLLIHALIAVLHLRWGRGVAFTALALLAAAFYIYYPVVRLLVIRQSLDVELAELQSFASFGIVLGVFDWYLIALPSLLGQGDAAVILAAASRQRGWIIGAAVALALTILAYAGNRVNRGLFRASTGRCLNADIKAAFHNLRKVVPTAFGNGIGGVAVHPVRIALPNGPHSSSAHGA